MFNAMKAGYLQAIAEDKERRDAVIEAARQYIKAEDEYLEHLKRPDALLEARQYHVKATRATLRAALEALGGDHDTRRKA